MGFEAGGEDGVDPNLRRGVCEWVDDPLVQKLWLSDGLRVEG